MGQAADVRSVNAVRAFKANLLEFQTALRQTLETLHNEVNRGIEWLESDRTAYWPAQVRRASDKISEASIALERCMLATRSDERRSCYDEKKAFEHAKQRLAVAEQKVRVTKHWLRVVHHQSEEFQSRLARLEQIVEYELPRGVAMLERMARALDKYVSRDSAVVERSDPSGPSHVDNQDGIDPTNRDESPSKSTSPNERNPT